MTRIASLALVAAVAAACTSSHPAAHSSAGVTSPSALRTTATPTPSADPVPTTPVPAPTPGNLHSTVASGTAHTLAPVALSSPARFNASVSATLSRVARTHVTGRLPGEVSGAGLTITVSFTNHSRAAVSMANVVVNVSDAAHVPLVAVDSASAPVAAELSPGRSASGTYVFDLSKGFRDPATVSVSYSTAAPVILFVGKA